MRRSIESKIILVIPTGEELTNETSLSALTQREIMQCAGARLQSARCPAPGRRYILLSTRQLSSTCCETAGRSDWWAGRFVGEGAGSDCELNHIQLIIVGRGRQSQDVGTTWLRFGLLEWDSDARDVLRTYTTRVKHNFSARRLHRLHVGARLRLMRGRSDWKRLFWTLSVTRQWWRVLLGYRKCTRAAFNSRWAAT